MPVMSKVCFRRFSWCLDYFVNWVDVCETSREMYGDLGACRIGKSQIDIINTVLNLA